MPRHGAPRTRPAFPLFCSPRGVTGDRLWPWCTRRRSRGGRARGFACSGAAHRALDDQRSRWNFQGLSGRWRPRPHLGPAAHCQRTPTQAWPARVAAHRPHVPAHAWRSRAKPPRAVAALAHMPAPARVGPSRQWCGCGPHPRSPDVVCTPHAAPSVLVGPSRREQGGGVRSESPRSHSRAERDCVGTRSVVCGHWPWYPRGGAEPGGDGFAAQS